MNTRNGRASLCFVLCLGLLSLSFFGNPQNIFAQDLDEATISGKITDQLGAIIPGVSVTAVLVAENQERAANTDSEGRYRLVELKPGVYKIRVTAIGFGDVEQIDVNLLSGDNRQINFELKVAGVMETTVVINDETASPVDTTRTVVGGTVTQREVEELPNVSRNPLDLVFTLPGVTEEPLSTRDLSSDRGVRGVSAPGTTPEEAGVFALSGGAAYSNNITIDGLDNNDDRTAGFRFQPSIEAVAEVQVVTNQFSAEYGRASGGRVNIRTRAGSNQYRGRAFYFFRSDTLNANTWNNNRRGIERPPFTNHDPGATFSGPIIKDKLFFFAAYEFDKIQEDTLIDAFVPVNSSSRLSLPAPTNPNQVVAIGTAPNVINVAPYIEPFGTPARRHTFSIRSDYNLSENHNFTFGYQLGRSNDLRQFSGTNRLADSLIGRIRNTDGFNTTYNWIVTPKTVNQFRFQYSTLRPFSAASEAENPVVLITFTPPGESSTTQIFGSSTTGSSDRREKRFQFQDTLNYTIKAHTLRAGADFQRVNSTYIDRFDTTGTYRFSNFSNFSQNSVTSLQQAFNSDSRVRNTYYGVFLQDDWRVRSNVSLSLGVRYENETVVDDNNNFGPRAAIAWNPFKGEKTVIRAGAGIFYNRVLLRTIDDFTAGEQEFYFDSRNFTTAQQTAARAFLSGLFPNPRPLSLDTRVPVDAAGTTRTVRELAISGQAFRSLDPTLKIPESYQFNAGFERELFKGLVFESNLTFNKTARLWREYNQNAPVLPGDTTDRDNNGTINFTDYLLGVTSGPNRFVLGSTADTGGTRVSTGTAACTATTPLCIVNLNTTNVTQCSNSTNSAICRAFTTINNLRPFAARGIITQLERVASIGNSEYRGLTVELRNRYRTFGRGFGGALRFAYTLAKLNDDGIVNTSEATTPGDFSSEFARSLLDRRHRVAFSATFDTPKQIGGLRFSPLFRFGSGAPFNLGNGGNDRNLDDISNDRPNFAGNLEDINFRKFGTEFPEELAAQFSAAPIGSAGNLPRNVGNGPRLYLFDLNVSREIRFGERFRLRPAVEFDNLLNMTVFSFGSNFIDFDQLNSTNATTRANARNAFLAPTRTVRPRQIRLGLRFDF